MARWEKLTFAFLLTHTGREGAEIALERIRTYVEQNLRHSLPASSSIAFRWGIRTFDPERDLSADLFIGRALPPDAAAGGPDCAGPGLASGTAGGPTGTQP